MNKFVSKLFIITSTLLLTGCNEVKPFEPKFKKYGTQLDMNIFYDQLSVSTKSNAQTFFGTDNISYTDFSLFILKQNVEFSGISSQQTKDKQTKNYHSNSSQNELQIVIDFDNQRLSYSSSTKSYKNTSERAEDFTYSYRTIASCDQENLYIEWGQTYREINPDLKTVKIYSDTYRSSMLNMVDRLLSSCFFPSFSSYYREAKFYKNGNVFTICSENTYESHITQLDFSKGKKISVKSKDTSNYDVSEYITFTQYVIKPTSSKVKKINYKNFYTVA